MKMADAMSGETTMTPASADDFWSPRFNYERRDDGTILMWQPDPLPPYLPTIADYLDKWADADPNRPWLARRNNGGDWVHVTYGAARDAARAIGASLLDLGLGPDRPLLILSENSIEHGLLGLACLYTGIPFAPVATAYSLVSQDHGKLKGIAALLKPGAVFADDGQDFAHAFAAIDDGKMRFINHRNGVDGALAYDDLKSGDPARARTARAEISPDTVVKYLFTSGSTGSPKAVINTNGMICAMQAMVRDCYRFAVHTPPVVLDWAPWNHTAAGNKVSYFVLTNGGTYYIDDGRPVPGKFAETLRNLREVACTWYFNVPVGWDMLVGELEADTDLAANFFSNLKMMFFAGAGMAQHTWDRLRAIARTTTGRDVLLATSLGATETAPFALAWTEIDDKSGNVGVPSRGLVMKLAPNGGKLELRLKGPTMTPGYYGDPQTTAEAFDEEGFYCMGDALRPIDPDDLSRGFLFDGRTAENFKLNTGTWVTVGVVRAKLVDAMGGLVRDAVIVGENRAELGALLIPSEAALKIDPAALQAALAERLAAAAKAATGSSSRVKRAMLIAVPPSLDAGEATEKGSLNQRALRANRADQVEAMYADADGVIRA